jgi:hypothetical protein
MYGTSKTARSILAVPLRRVAFFRAVKWHDQTPQDGNSRLEITECGACLVPADRCS